MQLSDRAVEHLRRVAALPETTDGRYTPLERIGRGGMGEVYRARDERLGRDVALKVLAVDGHGARLEARMRREAAILARLEHPGIVPVHDAGALTDGRPFYVMRLVRGEPLHELAARIGARGDLLRLFLQLCDTVGFAHSRGVIHRDLKPANVMVGPFGEVLVLDWGIARAGWSVDRPPAGEAPAECGGREAGPVSAGAETTDGTVLGTPGFMAPEQAAGSARVDARADVHGLGAILRELLAAAREPAPRPLLAIVARATAPDPDARYATVEALADDVRRWMDGEAVSALPEGALGRALRLYRRHQTAILLVAAYLVMRIVILLWREI